MDNLTFEDAVDLVKASIIELDARALTGMSIVVVDVWGGVLAARRDKKAPRVGLENARKKATCSLRWNRPTLAMAEIFSGNNMFAGLQLVSASDGEILMIGGGAPLYREGALVGALGIAGAAPEHDDAAVKAAAARAGLSIA